MMDTISASGGVAWRTVTSMAFRFPSGRSERERAGKDDRRLARIGGADFADSVEFFAAALEFALDGLEIHGRNHEDHAHAAVEGTKQFIAVDIPDPPQVAEDGKDRPGAELDNRLNPARQN